MAAASAATKSSIDTIDRCSAGAKIGTWGYSFCSVPACLNQIHAERDYRCATAEIRWTAHCYMADSKERSCGANCARCGGLFCTEHHIIAWIGGKPVCIKCAPVMRANLVAAGMGVVS